MAIKPISQERLNEVQEQIQSGISPELAPQNVDSVLSLDPNHAEIIDFGGEKYELLPVPFPIALKLQQVWLRLGEMKRVAPSTTTLPIYSSILWEALGPISKCMRPVSRRRRILRRLGIGRDPFRKATEGDIAWFLGFFLARRMMSHVSVS